MTNVGTYRSAADRALAMRLHSGASLLEVYQAFGGQPEKAPRHFKLAHAEQNRGDVPLLPSGSNPLEFSVEDDETYYGDPGHFCAQTWGTQEPCGPLGNIEIGVFGAPNGVCSPEVGLDAWESYTTGLIASPFLQNQFGAFDALGAIGEFASGESSGDRNITIPATISGGIIICDRDVNGSSDQRFSQFVIEEELFAGAWFILYGDGPAAPYSSRVYGIVFVGDLSHHSIRIRVRFADGDAADQTFFWAASY